MVASRSVRAHATVGFDLERLQPDAYVRIGADNLVTVVSKHAEFGQGAFTGLATLVAEELDADWMQMRVVAAPANSALYGLKNLGGLQATGGSRSMATSFDLMRRAGAMARAMLVSAAARRWNVPQEEISVSQGVLSHDRTGRHETFGALAEFASQSPVPIEFVLKQPAEFKLIGREGVTKRVDVAAKVNGTAQYTLDIYEQGMLTAVVAHAPRFGATLVTFDAAAALKVKGVIAVKPIPSGVAIYAESTWPALQARDLLHVRWNDAEAERRGSEEITTQYLALTRSPGEVVSERGDVDAAFVAGKVIERTYAFPYLAHAPMEPLNGFIKWDGTSADVRFTSQLVTFDRRAVAQVLGVPVEKIALETTLGGGSFGRRASFTSHFARELAEVAKAIGPGRAVKLVWPREEEFRDGYFRPLVVHRLRGCIDRGLVTAWSNSIASQPMAANTGFADRRAEHYISDGARDQPYAFVNFRCDVHEAPSVITTNPWRAVGHTHATYAVECFLDTLLDEAGKDPVSGRLDLLGDNARLKRTLRAVAKLAGWDGPGPRAGRARGVAIAESYGSAVAQIAEVSLDEDGNPRVHKVWCAVECGLAINPDIVRAQIEGGIGFGLGHALYGEVPIRDGAAMVTNFHEYTSLALAQAPDVEVIIVPSSAPPSGVGETGVPPIAPAIVNALSRLGRDRPSRLPMVRMAPT
jgi:isoquinoline 1-oxidoreductase beta subunit